MSDELWSVDLSLHDENNDEQAMRTLGWFVHREDAERLYHLIIDAAAGLYLQAREGSDANSG